MTRPRPRRTPPASLSGTTNGRSCRCPAVTTKAIGVPWRSRRAYIFIPHLPRLRHIWAELAIGGYQGGLRGWLGKEVRRRLVIVNKPQRGCRVGPGQEPPPRPRGFQVLKRRGVVERTFGWWRR